MIASPRGGFDPNLTCDTNSPVIDIRHGRDAEYTSRTWHSPLVSYVMDQTIDRECRARGYQTLG